MNINIALRATWTLVVVCAVMAGLVSPSRVLAGNNNVNICHFQEENDSWKLLSLPQPSSVAHLEHHDDAIASGFTAQTGTALDADCVEITATCPCGDAISIVNMYGMFEFDGPQVIHTGVEPDVVFYNARDSLDSIPHNPQLVLNANTSSTSSDVPLCIYRMTDEVGTFVINEEHVNLSAEEGERCRKDVIDVIDQNATE